MKTISDLPIEHRSFIARAWPSALKLNIVKHFPQVDLRGNDCGQYAFKAHTELGETWIHRASVIGHPGYTGRDRA